MAACLPANAVGSARPPSGGPRGALRRRPTRASTSCFRYGHVLSGITWIGLLYFFNFVQVPAFAELSDGARSEALRKLTFRALWWFRYAALATFLFGLAPRSS